MGIEENKASVRMFYDEVWNRGNLSVVDKMTAENFVDHNPPPGATPGREGSKQTFQMIRAAFPDGLTTIDDIIAEGDKVVVRATMTGTHQGDFMGIPATGKPVKITGIDVMRFEQGQAVERWGEWDTAGLMQQLGVAPPPPQALETPEESETPGEPENE
ncbi:MAG TPA: ester cyclase [Thermoplasmata archaeon]